MSERVVGGIKRRRANLLSRTRVVVRGQRSSNPCVPSLKSTQRHHGRVVRVCANDKEEIEKRGVSVEKACSPEEEESEPAAEAPPTAASDDDKTKNMEPAKRVRPSEKQTEGRSRVLWLLRVVRNLKPTHSPPLD